MVMRLLLFALVLSGCPGSLGGDPSTDGGGGGSGGTGGGSGGGTGGVDADGGLPCEVAALVSASCVSCHGEPVSGGAPMPLRTRADFLAVSALDATKNQAERSLLRMRDAAAPMPPGAPLPATTVDAFAAWVTAGLPSGSCAPPDAGPPVLTCASNTFAPMPTAGDAHGGPTMSPGWACFACHSGADFQGQNPGGQMDRLDVRNDYMGTVFVAPHEKDLCSPQLPTGATVEILTPAGAVVARLTVNAGGNFYGDATGAKPASYTARVVTSTGVRTMSGAQTSGDCNTCHTAEGREGAPGRIFLP